MGNLFFKFQWNVVLLNMSNTELLPVVVLEQHMVHVAPYNEGVVSGYGGPHGIHRSSHHRIYCGCGDPFYVVVSHYPVGLASHLLRTTNIETTIQDS